MIRLAPVLAVSLLLAGCVGADPYSMIAAGQAAIEATSAARQVSAAETRGAVDAALLESTRYAGEIMAVEAQVRGTEAAVAYEQTAIAVQETRSASDLQATAARATSQVIEMQATQAYLVQYASGMSTATAIIQQRELMATATAGEYARARSWRALALFLGWGVAVGVLGLFGTLVYAAIINARARAAEKLAHADYLYRRGIVDQTPQLPAGPGDAAENNGTVQFLWDCASVAGSGSSVIPSHRRMQISSRPWQREVKRLVKAGAVAIEPNRGSRIKSPYHNIDRLYGAITSGGLALPPYPTEDEYQYLFGTETDTETEAYYGG